MLHPLYVYYKIKLSPNQQVLSVCYIKGLNTCMKMPLTVADFNPLILTRMRRKSIVWLQSEKLIKKWRFCVLLIHCVVSCKILTHHNRILQVIRSISKQATSPRNIEHLNTIPRTMNTKLTQYHFCIIPYLIMFSKPH